MDALLFALEALLALLLIVLVLMSVICYKAGIKQGYARAERERTHDHDAEIQSVQTALHNKAEESAALNAQNIELSKQIEYLKAQLVDAGARENRRLTQEHELREAKSREDSRVIEALKPVDKNLSILQARVQSIEEARKLDMGALTEKLRDLNGQMLRLDSATQNLTGALCDNKTRGSWGELQLENIVRAAGLTKYVDFVTQKTKHSAEGADKRPDMVIHLPGQQKIPVDAKAPFDAYKSACDLDSAQYPNLSPEALNARKKELLDNHAKALRKHIRDLATKKYWEEFDEAPDIVIAFIPSESLLRAAIEADPNLLNFAFEQHVALASPITLWSMLKAIAYGWQQQELSQNAQKICELSQTLYDRIVTWAGYADSMGKSISKTVGVYNKFVGALEARVLVTARQLQKLQDKDIPSLEPLSLEDGGVRSLAAPDLVDKRDAGDEAGSAGGAKAERD